MFKNNFVASQKEVASSATHPALPGMATLRLRSENGTTERANPEYGSVTVNHTPTKELGGGFRHVVRNNLRAQGDISPASAHIVAIGRDTLEGEGRCVQAIFGLLGVLAQLHEDITIISVNGDGLPLLFQIGDSEPTMTWTDVLSSNEFKAGLERLVGRES